MEIWNAGLASARKASTVEDVNARERLQPTSPYASMVTSYRVVLLQVVTACFVFSLFSIESEKVPVYVVTEVPVPVVTVNAIRCVLLLVCVWSTCVLVTK